ncbi:unnamed protein product, partial [Rotaria magnacalcarata]
MQAFGNAAVSMLRYSDSIKSMLPIKMQAFGNAAVSMLRYSDS